MTQRQWADQEIEDAVKDDLAFLRNPARWPGGWTGQCRLKRPPWHPDYGKVFATVRPDDILLVRPDVGVTQRFPTLEMLVQHWIVD